MKKKLFNRIVSIVFSAVMLTSLMPIGILAEGIEENTKYDVSLISDKGGQLFFANKKGEIPVEHKTSYKEGSTVYVTAEMNEGFKITTLDIKDKDANGVEAVKAEDNDFLYSFVMPASDVTVTLFSKEILKAEGEIVSEVKYGEGEIFKNENGTFTVIPAEGSRIWKVVGYNRIFDNFPATLNEDGSYSVGEEVSLVRAFIVTNDEYEQIMAALDGANIDTIHENPYWFFKFGLNKLTDEQIAEIYAERNEALAKETTPIAMPKSTKSEKPMLKAARLPYKPEVNQDLGSGIAHGTNANLGHSSPYTLVFDTEILAGMVETNMYCVDPSYPNPIYYGYYSLKVASVDESTETCVATVYFSPDAEVDHARYPGDARDASTINNSQELTGSITLSYANKTGKIKLTKSSNSPSITDGNDAYSLEGAVYGVYNNSGCTTKVDELTTGVDGVTNEIELPIGRYYIKEITASPGYQVNDTAFTIDVTADCQINQPVEELPIYGKIDLTKESADTSITDGNDAYSLEGAVYGLYSNASFTNLLLSKSTNSDGKLSFTEIPLGTYFIKEITPSNGYKLDENPYQVDITTSKTSATITSKETPNLGKINLTKISTMPEMTADSDCYSLKDAEYGIYTNAACTNLVKSAKTDADGKVLFDAIPLGLYFIKEITPSKGFRLSNAVGSAVLSKDTPTATITLNEEPLDDPFVIHLEKKAKDLGGIQFSLEGTEFLVSRYDNMDGDTSGSPAQTWTIATTTDKEEDAYVIDMNGTNGTFNKGALVAGELFTSEDNRIIWPIGTYTLKETKASNGYTIKGNTLTDNTTGETITDGIFVTVINGGDADHNDIDATNFYTCNNYPVTLTTSAKNAATKIQYMPTVGQGTIEDTVIMDYIDPRVGTDDEVSTRYKLVSEFVDADTKTVYETKTNVFTIDSFLNNKYTVEWEILDTSVYAGKAITVFESLYLLTKDAEGTTVETLVGEEKLDADGNIIPEQTVWFPGIGTTLTEKESGLHIADSKSLTLTDVVSYTGLKAGVDYTIKGHLVDKNTEKAIENTSFEKTVHSDGENGTWAVEFNVDASALAGHTIVAFEELYYNTTCIAQHKDIDDANQSVRIPKITTTLTDVTTGEKISLAKETSNFVDKVTINNIIPDTDYRLVSSIYNKKTGEIVKDSEGRDIKQSQIINSSGGSTTIDVPFVLDTTALAGNSIVAFQELYTMDDELITSHASIDDEEQTVKIPKVTTKLKDTTSGLDITLANNNCSLTDTVNFENLIPNKDYVIESQLKDLQGDAYITFSNGSNVITTTIKPSKASDKEDIKLDFDSSALAGHTLVAYEVIKYNGNVVAIHCDDADVEQIIRIPEIKTEIKDNSTGTHAGNIVDKKANITDVLTYKNLTPGTEYEVVGTIMDRGTGEPFKNLDGSVATTTKLFTPENPEGTVDVPFTITIDKNKTYTLTAYEEVKCLGYTVASDKNINNEDQTVYFTTLDTTAYDINMSKYSYDEEGGLILDEVSHTGVVGKTTFRDTVVVNNLSPKSTYSVKGNIVFAEDFVSKDGTITAKAGDLFKDADGKAYEITKPIEKITNNNAVVVLEFEVDTTDYSGATFVITDTLMANMEPAVVHDDLTDADQRINLTEISTCLSNGNKKFHTEKAAEEMKLEDEIVLTNLIKGEKYEIKGTLMDAETGEAALDNDGNKIESKECKFEAEDGAAIKTIEYEFNGVNLAGKSLVSFVSILHNDKEFAQHKDINDAEQTVIVPAIETELIDTKTLSHTALNEKEMTFKDTVSLKHAGVNYFYVAEGYLVDKDATAQNLLEGMSLEEAEVPIVDEDGEIIKASDIFAVISEDEKPYSDASIELTFDIKDVDLAGKDIIAFERIYAIPLAEITQDKYPVIFDLILDVVSIMNKYEEDSELPAEEKIAKIAEELKASKAEKMEGLHSELEIIAESDSRLCVAEHTDITDVLQMVSIPSVKTTATNKADGTHKIVTYKKADAKSSTSELEKVVNSEEKNKSTKAEAEKAAEDKSLKDIEYLTTATINDRVDFTKLTNTDLFEEATRCDMCNTIMTKEEFISHDCIDDGEYTSGLSATVSHMRRSNKSELINDEYLISNYSHTYKLTATLINKETKKVASSNGKEITAEVSFTCKEEALGTGFANIELTFNPQDLESGDYVVFEELTDVTLDKVVGEHKDINDKDQTVTIILNDNPKTGFSTGLTALLMFLGVSAIFAGLLCVLVNVKDKFQE